jgi:hypothetical protein
MSIVALRVINRQSGRNPLRFSKDNSFWEMSPSGSDLHQVFCAFAYLQRQMVRNLANCLASTGRLGSFSLSSEASPPTLFPSPEMARPWPTFRIPTASCGERTKTGEIVCSSAVPLCGQNRSVGPLTAQKLHLCLRRVYAAQRMPTSSRPKGELRPGCFRKTAGHRPIRAGRPTEAK